MPRKLVAGWLVGECHLDRHVAVSSPENDRDRVTPVPMEYRVCVELLDGHVVGLSPAVWKFDRDLDALSVAFQLHGQTTTGGGSFENP